MTYESGDDGDGDGDDDDGGGHCDHYDTSKNTQSHFIDLTYSYSLVIVPHKSNTSKTLLGSAV